MATPIIDRRSRNWKILRLFFGLLLSLLLQYVRTRITGRSYSFFQDAQRNRQRAIRFRSVALEMGGVLIKIGQFLSSRVDLLPAEYIEELALLQDEVPGVPFEDIKIEVERELNGPLSMHFASFEEIPVAAASLGQVHRASLHSGAVVAVKVQRPNIDQIIEVDLRTVRTIVDWLDRFRAIRRRADLPAIMREFEDTLRLELDYQRECHHAERLSVLFSNEPTIAIPRIYWSHSRGTVVTMQFMTGVKVTDFAGLEQAGISRPAVAELLIRAYLMQILQFGFFHADPHPGNIFVRPGPVVVLLDFGMVGDISPKMRENIRQVFVGIVRRDFNGVIAALGRLGFFTRQADLQALKRALIWTVDTFYEMSFGELQAIDPIQVLSQLQDVLYAEAFQIPANFAFLGRALGTLSGLATALDPSFQFVTVAEPFARDLLRGDSGARGAFNQISREVRSLAATGYALPYLTRDVLQGVQQGEVDFQFKSAELVRAVDRLERVARRMLYALLLGALLLLAALLFPERRAAITVGAVVVFLLFLLAAASPFGRKA